MRAFPWFATSYKAADDAVSQAAIDSTSPEEAHACMLRWPKRSGLPDRLASGGK